MQLYFRLNGFLFKICLLYNKSAALSRSIFRQEDKRF